MTTLYIPMDMPIRQFIEQRGEQLDSLVVNYFKRRQVIAGREFIVMEIADHKEPA
jgi:hypothetical protein